MTFGGHLKLKTGLQHPMSIYYNPPRSLTLSARHNRSIYGTPFDLKIVSASALISLKYTTVFFSSPLILHYAT